MYCWPNPPANKDSKLEKHAIETLGHNSNHLKHEHDILKLTNSLTQLTLILNLSQDHETPNAVTGVQVESKSNGVETENMTADPIHLSHASIKSSTAKTSLPMRNTPAIPDATLCPFGVEFDLNTDPQILENPFLSLVPQDIPSSISSLNLGKDKNTCTCHLSYLVLYLGLNGVEIHNNISEDHAYKTYQ